MLEWDARRFNEPEDSLSSCRGCGLTLVLLPDDRRHGLCHDCFDPLEAYESLRLR